MTWNWRNRRLRLLLGVALLACALALTHPLEAHAGWPLEGSAPTLLAFGASYHAAEATATAVHHGVDLAAEAGDAVLAPLAGTVTFAGSVPAVGGGRATAVTISTAAGSLTLMPLERVSVARGEDVAIGASIGRVAETGDGSSASTHLHVGLRRGDLYVDPLSAISLAAPPPDPNVDPAPAGGASAASAASGVGAGEAAGVPVAPGVSLRPAHAGSAAHASASAPAPLRAPVPGARLAPGVAVAGAAPAVLGVGAVPLGGSLAAQVALQSARTRPAAAHAAGAGGRAGLSAGELVARLAQWVAGYTRVLGIVALMVLAAVGALWPLWRRQEGSGEDDVRAVCDDVAAAVGR